MDAVIERGVARLQAEPLPPLGLARTLDALGLRGAAERPAARPRARVPRMVGRAAAGIALALLGAALVPAFVSRTDTAVFAETLAALQKVRSYHWTGVQLFNGREQPWEVWYAPGHYREQIGDQTTVDDGVHERRYKAGSGIVIVDRSDSQGRGRMVELLQPGGFLRRMDVMARDQSWRKTEYRKVNRTRDGYSVEEYQIGPIEPGPIHRAWVRKSQFILRIDRDTKLPIRWVVTEWDQGREQLRARVDRIDYNVTVPTPLFELKAPAGTRSIEVDHRDRGESQLAAQTTPRGWKIILRAVDLTREGDLLVSVSQVPPGQDRPRPDPVMLQEVLDDRGTVYADTRTDYMAGTYTTFWLTSPVPPDEKEMWPQRFTITANVEDGETATFRDIRAPRPAFESVLQVIPGMDPDQVEKTRAAARTRLRSKRGE